MTTVTSVDALTVDELKTLIERREGVHVSIYMPTYRAGQEVQQNPIRFRNLLDVAEERLLAMGLRSTEVRELLESGYKLLADDFFWLHQNDGLAVFLSPGVFWYYRLPLSFEELVVVGSLFHMKPLFPLLLDGKFYILALSQKENRLLEGTRYSIREIDVPGVPKGLGEAIKYEDIEEQTQFHFRTPDVKGGKQVIGFHGHGVGTDDAKDNIYKYFRQIDTALHELLRDEKAPLIIAGVEYLHPIYREANTYPHLLDKGIEENPDEENVKELHRKAWMVVEPYFQKVEEEAMAQYQQLVGTGRTSSDIKEIVPAAYYGRVETVFVAKDIKRWGIFDPNTSEVHLHDEEEPRDEDLLDFAAAHTLLNGGTVFALDLEKLPNGGPLAAIFRY